MNEYHELALMLIALFLTPLPACAIALVWALIIKPVIMVAFAFSKWALSI